MMLWAPLSPGHLLLFDLSCNSTQWHISVSVSDLSCPTCFRRRGRLASMNQLLRLTFTVIFLVVLGEEGGVAATYHCRLWMNPNPNVASVHLTAWLFRSTFRVSVWVVQLPVRPDAQNRSSQDCRWLYRPCRCWTWQFQEGLYYINWVSWFLTTDKPTEPQLESHSANIWWRNIPHPEHSLPTAHVTQMRLWWSQDHHMFEQRQSWSS